MPMKIDSTFALLDIKQGRKQLAKRLAASNIKIPVTIHGHIVRTWSRDDGTSIEFEIEVTSAIENKKPATLETAAVALLQEMLDVFVPTIKSQSRLTQAQGSASIHARQLLERLKGDK